jgi:hypothetical protein
VLFSEFKHEEREKEGEAICKKVRESRIPLHVPR